MTDQKIEEQETLQQIALSDIQIKNNPRKSIDQAPLDELTESIKLYGVLQPIMLRPATNGEGKKYEIVFGERRFRASLAAEKDSIPAIIQDMNDQNLQEIQMIENLQRERIHWLDEAEAFMQMKDQDRSIEYIALRVGKSRKYVAARMKLYDLSENFKKAARENLLEIQMAFQLCQLSASDQDQLWKENSFPRYLKEKRPMHIHESNINRLKSDLNRAPFDTADPLLKKDMGACISCQFNTANSILFSDGKSPNSLCTMSKCFREKCDLSFSGRLQKAIEDPGAVLIVENWSIPSDNKVIKELLKKNPKQIIYTRNQFEVAWSRKKPEPNDYDVDDYKSRAEMEKAFQDDLKKWEGIEKQIEDGKKSGKYLQGFVLDGSNKGLYVTIELAKTKKQKEAKKKIENHSASKEDIKEEIERLKERSKRNQELDMEKIFKRISEAVEANDDLEKIGIKHQGKKDNALIAHLLLNEAGYKAEQEIYKKLKVGKLHHPNSKHDWQFSYFKALEKISDDDIAFLVRSILIDKFSFNPNVGGISADEGSIFLIAEYTGVDVKKIIKEQEEIAEKREARVKERIKLLNLQNKGKRMLSPKKKSALKK